jgi:ribosomal protein S18 acetylase RimI-like enzyme
MISPTITAATRAQQDPVIGVITLAFSTDPVVRWLYADPGQYLAHAATLMDAYGGGALDHGSAHCIDGYFGAALWLPPAAHPDHDAFDAFDALLERTVSKAQQSILNEAFEQMGHYHPPEPHWFLPLIGIDPSRQNQGLGSLLMQHAHDIFDRSNALAYLESSNERNIPFYQRHGYELLGTIRVGNCPPFSPMLRKPRPISAH